MYILKFANACMHALDNIVSDTMQSIDKASIISLCIIYVCALYIFY